MRHPLALVLLVLTLYAPAAHFEFIGFDDDQYVFENDVVRRGLGWEGVRWAFGATHAANWHPLTWISHMADVSLHGMDAGRHHLGNVFIHALNALLIYFLYARLLRSPWLAFFGAALIALHPLRIESVAWVSERKDVLSIAFATLSLLAYLGFRDRPSPTRYVMAFVSFLLGLMCKPSIVYLPALFVLLDVWNRRPVVKRYLVPFAILSLASAAITLVAQHAGGALKEGFDGRITSAFVAYLVYVGKLFWAGDLSVFYPFQRQSVALGIGALGALLVFSTWCYRRRPLWVGWGWFVAALLPVAGLVPFGGHAFADRYTYFAHVGLVLGILGWAKEGFPILAERWKAVGLAGATLLAVCFNSTWVQLHYWKDSVTLFSRAVSLNPDNFLAHCNLGAALDKRGEWTLATAHYEETVRLNPGYAEGLNNLGVSRARDGRIVEARELFQRALARDPAFARASYNLGLTYRAARAYTTHPNQGDRP